MEIQFFVLFISLVFIAIGLFYSKKVNRLLKIGRRATAMVIENKYEYSSSNGGLYFPVLKFEVEGQEWKTSELNIGFSPEKPIGTKMKIFYDPGDTAVLVIDSKFNLFYMPKLFLAIGASGLIWLLMDFTKAL